MSEVKTGDYLMLDNDKWEDHGKEYFVHKAIYREDTTAVSLVLEYKDEIVKRSVARNQIIKVN